MKCNSIYLNYNWEFPIILLAKYNSYKWMKKIANIYSSNFYYMWKLLTMNKKSFSYSVVLSIFFREYYGVS